jgi:DNA-binding phage protein
LLISHLGASSAAVTSPAAATIAHSHGTLFESARVHPDGRSSADNHASHLGWAFDLMDQQGRLFPDYEAEWTESFAVAPGVDERDAVLEDAASSLRDLVRSGAYSAASNARSFLSAGPRLSRVQRQRRMVDISQQLARAHADSSSPLYRLHASAAHLRNGSVIREALGALLEHGEGLWAADPSLPPQHAARLGVMRDTAHAFSSWFRQRLASPKGSIGTGAADITASGAGASDESGIGSIGLGEVEGGDLAAADAEQADDEDPVGAAAFIELRRLLSPPAPQLQQRHSHTPDRRRGHSSSGHGHVGSAAVPRSRHAAETLELPPGVGISGVTVTRLTQSQVVERSGRQLVSLLLETQSTAVALLEAGVGTQEIFACVVDNIMNMAPEIILQLIINAVRDPIIQLLGVLLAQITPDLLVPNLGQVPINVNPKGTLAKKSPAPPPCVCKGDDGSAYDPSEGVTGGASFLQMGEGVLLWRPPRTQTDEGGMHSGSGDAAWRAYPDEGQIATGARKHEAHSNTGLGAAGAPQGRLTDGVSVPPAAAALIQSMQELLAREGPGFGVHATDASVDAAAEREAGGGVEAGRRQRTAAALLEARTAAGSGGSRAPLHRVGRRGTSGGASGEDAPAAGDAGAASTSRSVVASLQAAFAAGRMMEVAPWCPCRPGHLGYSFVLLEVEAQGQPGVAIRRSKDGAGSAVPGTASAVSSSQHADAGAERGNTIASEPAPALSAAERAHNAEPVRWAEFQAAQSNADAAEAHGTRDGPFAFSPSDTLAFLEAELMRTLPATLREHVGAALASPPASQDKGSRHDGMLDAAAAAVHGDGYDAAALHKGSHHAAASLLAKGHEASEAALLESVLGSVDAAVAEAGMAQRAEGTGLSRDSASSSSRTHAGGGDRGVEGGGRQRLSGARFAAGGAAAQHRAGGGAASAGAARAKTQMQIAAEQEARQGAEADALNSAMAWVHESAYASANTYGGAGTGAGAGGGGGKGGPIGKMEPRIREEVDAGMAAIALPRVYALVAERLKTRLARTVPAAAHRAISREMIQGITRRLTVSLYRRLMAAVARPLVLRTATRLTAVLTPALARPISLALTQSLTHHPAADYFCEYCRIGGALPPLNATIDFTGAPLAEQAEGQRQGAYCAACARANAHDRLQDEHVTALVNRYARTYSKLAVSKVPELARRVLNPAPAATPAAAAGGGGNPKKA